MMRSSNLALTLSFLAFLSLVILLLIIAPLILTRSQEPLSQIVLPTASKDQIIIPQPRVEIVPLQNETTLKQDAN